MIAEFPVSNFIFIRSYLCKKKIYLFFLFSSFAFIHSTYNCIQNFNRRKNDALIIGIQWVNRTSLWGRCFAKYRSNRSKGFCEKNVIKSFTAKLIRKHLCQSFFFNKSCEVCKNTFFTEHLWGMDIHQNDRFAEYPKLTIQSLYDLWKI